MGVLLALAVIALITYVALKSGLGRARKRGKGMP